MPVAMPDELPLRVFLSHRYRSPEVNLYFYELFAGLASLQFGVDRGLETTSVARLERQVRAAQGFIGIYPYPGTEAGTPARADLLKESRYFRLELDLALRARKPALVFADSRYGNVIRAPAWVNQFTFDPREILSGRSPQEGSYRQAYLNFVGEVRAWVNYQQAGGMEPSPTGRVGVWLGQERFDRELQGEIAARIEDRGYEVVAMKWPPRLILDLFRQLHELDWVLIDIAPETEALSAFLHGAFVPQVRMKKIEREAEPVWSAGEECLFGAVEVGYRKDTVLWWDRDSLLAGIDKRLALIGVQAQLISTRDEAERYFRSAARRKEAVFVSYCGADVDEAQELVRVLKQRFQEVFDYRDGESIRPGQPWLKEIFERIARSPVGIPLLTPGYLASGNCRHELEEMVARQDSGKMRLIPVKLRKTDGEEFDLPPYLGNRQYLRRWEYPSAAEVVNRVIQEIERS